MHNTLSRVQNTFGFFTTCAFTLALLIALISLIPYPPLSSLPGASISVRNVQVVKGRPHYYSPKKEEYAHIRFDLEADLSDLFNWNTKQVFVYVAACYPRSNNGHDGRGAMSESMIWDTIVSAPESAWSLRNMRERFSQGKVKKTGKRRRESASSKTSSTTTKDLVRPGVLSLKNQKPKYQITDPSGVMGERQNATLVVGWNVQPWVGALVWDKGMLGKRIGAWEAGKTGRSEAFSFPYLKGSRAQVVKDQEVPEPPPAAEASPVV